MDIRELKMHETEVIKLDDRNKPQITRTRVPGGWIYTTIAINQRISTVFVPECSCDSHPVDQPKPKKIHPIKEGDK